MLKKMIVAALLLMGISATPMAQAQMSWSDMASPEFARKQARERCIREIRSGEDDYRRGAYNSAIWHFQNAQRTNDDYNGQFYNSRELSKKIDDCEYARRHGKKRPDLVEDAVDAFFEGLFGGTKKNDNETYDYNNRPRPKQSDDNNTLVERNSYGNEYFTKKGNINCKVKQVVCSPEGVMVEFEYYNSSDKESWMRISQDTYLKDHGDNRKLNLHHVEGIAVAPGKTTLAAGELATFRLFFGPLSDEADEFDIVEPNSTWAFYHLRWVGPAKPEHNSPSVPVQIK